MAEIAVQLLVERLSSLIVEEVKLLGEVGGEIQELKRDLETMRSLLRDADSKSETDQGVKTWVKQVRDVAYDTEDVLDEFLRRVVRTHPDGILGSVASILHIRNLKTRRDLAIEVQNIKARLTSISDRRIKFSFNDIGKGTGANSTTPNAWLHDPRIASLHIDEAEVVGIEVPKKKLIGWLTEGELKLTIISVLGMGGLGKTTLVKKVYDDQMVNKHFDCHVWITVSNSKSLVIRELLRAIISRSMIQVAELNDCNEVKSCRIHDLVREIIQPKSKEEYFSATIIGSQGMGVLDEKARRISIYHNTCEKYYSMSSRCSHIRSLLMIFKFDGTPYSFQKKFFLAFWLLRVLDLEGADLAEFPRELTDLIHLRYLSLRSTKITVLPKSVGKLKYLETLDLKQTGVSELPVEILKLQCLRHLLVYRYDFDLDSVTNNTYGVSMPIGIGNFTCLQKLTFLDVQDQKLQVLVL